MTPTARIWSVHIEIIPKKDKLNENNINKVSITDKEEADRLNSNDAEQDLRKKVANLENNSKENTK